ncbi:kelch-like [Cichlidogyrus casuarinus]|uniref:Kelch-like n=1 Tax=Cichlidogyrus casuarinus TaxID=1844966 RepID=A0ABD2QPV0_9PLAT
MSTTSRLIEDDTLKSRMFDALYDMRKKDEFCDVVLKCGPDGEKIILSHRIILIAASPYFQNRLPANVATLNPDFDIQSLRKVLDFMYSGSIRITKQNVAKIEPIVIEFELEVLRRKIEAFKTDHPSDGVAELSTRPDKFWVLLGDGETATQIYNFSTKTWKQDSKMIPNLPISIKGAVGVVLEDSIYVIGGETRDGEVLSGTYILEAGATNWIRGPDMTTARRDFAALVMDDSIYVFGGSDGRNVLESCEVLIGDHWYSKTPMHQARSHFGVASSDRKIYVFAGMNGDQKQSSVECYDPNNDVWEECLSCYQSGSATAMTFQGNIYLFTLQDKIVQTYSASEDSWAHHGELLQIHQNGVITSHGDDFLVAGGDNGKVVEKLDIAKGKWLNESEGMLYNINSPINFIY